MITYHDVLNEFYQDKEWVMRGLEYEGLEWLEKESEKPLKEDLDEKKVYLENMKSLPETLDSLFNTLEEEAKNSFVIEKLNVKLALKNKEYLAAKKIIEITQVPENLLPFKEELLLKFSSI